MISVRVEKDSICANGKRLTTFVCTYPRFIHSELMTHRMFSRNAASSRAIPVSKMIEAVQFNPVLPLHYGKNQPGMQAKEELDDVSIRTAEQLILSMRDEVIRHVQRLVDLGLHKQIANRYLEPFQHITTIITATEWENFYALRNHPDAQPEFQALAAAMLKAHNESEPTFLKMGEWHLPFVRSEEIEEDLELAKKYSVARCARVSYLNHDGTEPDRERDLKLFTRLFEAGHVSPFEHQATPAMYAWNQSGNFFGWNQYRKELPNECRYDYPLLKNKVRGNIDENAD